MVYTTYDGHASRGNWGLKRPLTLTKRKDTYRTIKSVDSRAQQTEWYPAQNAVNWLRVATDFGQEPILNQEEGNWFDTLGCELKTTYDSDYQFYPESQRRFSPFIWKNPDGWQSQGRNRLTRSHVLNTAAMSPRELEAHLERHRRLQLDFKKFVAKERSSSPSYWSKHEFKEWETGASPGAGSKMKTLRTNFFQGKMNADFTKSGSTALHPSPHHNAGFSYTRASDVTNMFLHEPLPARFLSSSKKANKPAGSAPVCVAGIIAYSSRLNINGRRPVSMGNVEQHEEFFNVRAAQLSLITPPTVTTTPDGSGFNNTRVAVEVVDSGKLLNMKSNPHPPGSTRYIAHPPPSKHARLSSPGEKLYRRNARPYGAVEVESRVQSALQDLHNFARASHRPQKFQNLLERNNTPNASKR